MSRSPFRKTPRKYVLSDWSKRDEKLMLAVERGQAERVQHLLTHKQISPFKIDPKRQVTAFHRAALDGKAEIVELILRDGNGGVNTKDLLGRTPLHCAVHMARQEVTKKLLELGADVLLVDHNSWSVLHHACVGGHIGCIQLLLAKAAPVYLKDKEGVSPLTLAATRGQATICRILLENGADVNDTDSRNRTPLMKAAEYGHTALCEYLLTKGAVVELADKEGHDALWYAVNNKHRDAVKVLQRRGLHSPVAIKDTESRSSMGKIVEEWRLPDHAYEAVQEISGEESPQTSSISSHKQPITPPSSIASRERMPSPAEEFPVDRAEEELEKDEPSHEYSRIDDLEQAEGNVEKLRNVEKMKFAGASFRTFVDEAFGLGNEIAEIEKAKGGELPLPSERPHQLGEERKKRGTGEVIEEEPEKPEEEIQDNGSQTIRSFMTGSDVISAEQLSEGISLRLDSDSTDLRPDVLLTSDGRLATTSDAVRYATVLRSDEVVAKEIVDSIIRSIVSSETEAAAEDMQETTSGQKTTSGQVKGEEETLWDEGKEALPEQGVGDARKRDETSDTEAGEERSSEWPSLSQMLASESDLKDLFQHISDLERENSNLRRELELVQQERSSLERAKKEVEKNLSLILNRQQWIHQELCQMHQFLGEVKERLASDLDLEERMRRAAVDVDTLERHLAALINLEVEGIEDVEIYVSLRDLRMEGSPDDSSAQLSAAVAKLERENKALIFQLRQALRENRQLQTQMEDVERFVNVARELKEENEAMIADYRRFREVQEEEVSEMDELAELFKETLEENKQLQAENEALKVKVVELQGLLDSSQSRDDAAAEVERLAKENRGLRYEITQLTEAVNRESQTILELDERLRSYNTHAVPVLKDIVPEVEEKRRKDVGHTDEGTTTDDEVQRLNKMYEELKSQTVVMLKDLEERKNAEEELERLSEEFEERGQEIVHLRSTLDRKNSEIRQLTEQAEEMNRHMELVFDEFKKDEEEADEKRKTELQQVLEENLQLKEFIYELGKVEEEKERIRSTRVDGVLKQSTTLEDVSGKKPKTQGLESGSSNGETTERHVTISDNQVLKSGTISVETQTSDGDLEVLVKVEDDTNENILEDLQKAVDLTKTLMEENKLLKRQLKSLNAENERYRNQLAKLSLLSSREEDLEKVRSINSELQKEIRGLKRTINEQSMYLHQIGHNGSLLGSTSFPSEADERTDSEGLDGNDHDDQRSVATSGQTDQAEDGKGNGKRSAEAQQKLHSELYKTRTNVETGNGSGTGSRFGTGNGFGLPLKSVIESEREDEEDPSGSGFDGKVYPHGVDIVDDGTFLITLTSGRRDPDRVHKCLERKEVKVQTYSGKLKQVAPDSEQCKWNGNGITSDDETLEQMQTGEDTTQLLRQEVLTKNGKIKELEEAMEELMSEVERRDDLEKECGKIVQDYKLLINEFGKCKTLFNLETKSDGTPFGELKDWLNKYLRKEEVYKKLNEERQALQGELELARKRLHELKEERSKDYGSLTQWKSDLEKQFKEELDLRVMEVSQLRQRVEDLTAEKEEREKEKQELASKFDEINTKSAQLRHEEGALRAENETLKCLLESKSPQLDSNYEEHLLTEIERLTEVKEILERKLKERDYELDETRDELMEELDALRMKMEMEQKKAERECSEIMDDQDQLIEENKKLMGKITALERDVKDTQEMFDEEKVASEKNRELLEEEIEQLKEERKRKAEEESDLVTLCDTLTDKLEALDQDMKKITLEKNQALSQCKTFQVAHVDLEKVHKELGERISLLQAENESLTRTMEREKNAVEEINKRLTERLENLREENEKLAKENEKLGLILEMEKLKNFATDAHSTLTSQEGPSKEMESAVKPSSVDQSLQTDLRVEAGIEVEEEIQALRKGNRKLALEVAELHCQLSQKLLPFPEEKEGTAGSLGRNTVRQILRDFARENLRHLQVMADTEDRCDQLKREIRKMRQEYDHLEQENRSRKELSGLHPRSWNELVEALRQENTKLKEFVAVLEDLMSQRSTTASPEASSTSPIRLVPRNSGRVSVTSPDTTFVSRSQDSGISPNHTHEKREESSVVRVFQLQRKLQENDQKYRDIISTYRRHLLSSVQGTIDPEVKAALLRIVDLRHSSQEL